MSTAFYPTNMRQQSASGYSNGSTLENIPYIPWKGRGVFSNPVGVTATHIRPLTNRDPGNIFPTGFGKARPIKHYRKGTVIPILLKEIAYDAEKKNVGEYVESRLIAFNTNRAVKSSLGSSLGGGNGGTGLISQLIDMPGSFIVKDNGKTIFNEQTQLLNSQDKENNLLGDIEKLKIETGLAIGSSEEGIGNISIDADCKTCNGVGLVSSWMPINNLTEKPQINVTNPLLCCNQQRKAIQRVLPTNTNLKKNYYQTTGMYLYNRCQTFQQRQFNFTTGPIDKEIIKLFLAYPFVTAKILEYSKPGDALALTNYYVAQCNPNFTIETAVEIGFISYLSKSLLQAKFITQEEFDLLIGDSSANVQSFINNLKTILSKDKYDIVIAYLYQLAADPYNGSVLSGPSNPKGCAQVIYKPNNPQFAKQGGVSSSTRILKLNVDTISTAVARQRTLTRGLADGVLSSLGSGSFNPNTAISLAYAQSNNNSFIYKDKVPSCQPQTYIGNPFFFQGQHQNKLICRNKTTGAEYHTYNSVNSGSAGNYIGATQSGGSGYRNTSGMSSANYFDNLGFYGNKIRRTYSA